MHSHTCPGNSITLATPLFEGAENVRGTAVLPRQWNTTGRCGSWKDQRFVKKMETQLDATLTLPNRERVGCNMHDSHRHRER